ncbi:hypothetical protein CBS101457_002621 [Exobasidium rhododendri]|nr:hypothetical protein CBS101457_002621 [Exobasidium rhododendri]
MQVTHVALVVMVAVVCSIQVVTATPVPGSRGKEVPSSYNNYQRELTRSERKAMMQALEREQKAAKKAEQERARLAAQQHVAAVNRSRQAAAFRSIIGQKGETQFAPVDVEHLAAEGSRFMDLNYSPPSGSQ